MYDLDSSDIEHLLWIIAREDETREKEVKQGVNPLECNTCLGLKARLTKLLVGAKAIEELWDD